MMDSVWLFVLSGSLVSVGYWNGIGSDPGYGMENDTPKRLQIGCPWSMVPKYPMQSFEGSRSWNCITAWRSHGCHMPICVTDILLTIGREGRTIPLCGIAHKTPCSKANGGSTIVMIPSEGCHSGQGLRPRGGRDAPASLWESCRRLGMLPCCGATGSGHIQLLLSTLINHIAISRGTGVRRTNCPSCVRMISRYPWVGR